MGRGQAQVADLFSPVLGDRRGVGRLDPDNRAMEVIPQHLRERPTLVLVDLSGSTIVPDGVRLRIHEFLRQIISLGEETDADLRITGYDGAITANTYQLYSSEEPCQDETLELMREGKIGGTGSPTASALAWVSDNTLTGARIIVLTDGIPSDSSELPAALRRAYARTQSVNCLAHGTDYGLKDYQGFFGLETCTYAPEHLFSGFNDALIQSRS